MPVSSNNVASVSKQAKYLLPNGHKITIFGSIKSEPQIPDDKRTLSVVGSKVIHQISDKTQESSTGPQTQIVQSVGPQA